jgi:hypothetical protein
MYLLVLMVKKICFITAVDRNNLHLRLHFLMQPGYLSQYRDRLGARQRGFDSQLGQDFSVLLHSVPTGFETHPTSYPTGTGGSFTWGRGGVKCKDAKGHEADHSLPSSSKVKNGAVISPLPRMTSWPYSFFCIRSHFKKCMKFLYEFHIKQGHNGLKIKLIRQLLVWISHSNF